MRAIEALERRIDELCRENEQLRQQVASIIGRSFKTADKMDCLDTENEQLRQYNNTLREQVDIARHNSVRNAREYARLCRVNDKLRELVRELYEDQCIDGDQWKYRDRMRELGIEVDK